jgi:hypothetical protein
MANQGGVGVPNGQRKPKKRAAFEQVINPTDPGMANKAQVAVEEADHLSKRFASTTPCTTKAARRRN